MEAGEPEDSDQHTPLAQAIREARASAGVRSQAEVGRRVADILDRDASIHQTVIGSWMRGEAVPSIDQVLALDEAFGLERGTILTRAGLIKQADVLSAIASDTLLDVSAKEVFRWMYIAIVDCVSRQRTESGGVKDDVKDRNLITHYLAWMRKRVRAWQSGSEPHPGPITADELVAAYDPLSPAGSLPEQSSPADEADDQNGSIADDESTQAKRQESRKTFTELVSVLAEKVEELDRILKERRDPSQTTVPDPDVVNLYVVVHSKVNPVKWELVQRHAWTAARAYVTEFRKNGWQLGGGEAEEIALVLNRALDASPSERPEDIQDTITKILKSGKRSEMTVHPDDLHLANELASIIDQEGVRLIDDVGAGKSSRRATALQWALQLASSMRESGTPLNYEVVVDFRRKLSGYVASKTDQTKIAEVLEDWKNQFSVEELDQKFSEARRAWSEQLADVPTMG